MLGSCLECGCSFELLVIAGARKRFCSDDCKKSYRRTYYKAWVDKNREAVLSKMKVRLREWSGHNPDYWKRYYAENRERRKSERRRWFEANRDRASQRCKEYDAANREVVRRIGRKSAQTRRARKANVFVEIVDPQVVLERDKGICGICSQPVLDDRWEVDHVIALANGGVHSYSNVQLSHLSCNRSKGARVAS